MNFTGKKGVIFDFNGTLLWDTHLHNRAWNTFLEKHGFSLSDEEKHQRIHGRLNSEILTDLFGDDLADGEIHRYTLEKEYEYQRLCIEQNLSLADGVVSLFESLKKRGIPFVIATASGIENIEFYRKRFDLDKWFLQEHIIYNDGTMRGKPCPDLFRKALSTLGLRGEDTVIFEDSISGIKAAEAVNASQIIIVNSNEEDYKEWKDKYPVITNYGEIDWKWF